MIATSGSWNARTNGATKGRVEQVPRWALVQIGVIRPGGNDGSAKTKGQSLNFMSNCGLWLGITVFCQEIGKELSTPSGNHLRRDGHIRPKYTWTARFMR